MTALELVIFAENDYTLESIAYVVFFHMCEINPTILEHKRALCIVIACCDMKVKTVKVPLVSKQDGVTDMFNQMVGAGETLNMSIVYPKYKHMRDQLLSSIVKLLSFLENALKQSKVPFDEVTTFRTQIEAWIETGFNIDLTDFEWDLNAVDDEVKKRFSAQYSQNKIHPLMNTLIKIYDSLLPYQKHIENVDALSWKFIINMAGVDWSPLVFTKLNLKNLFICANDANKRLYITILSKLFTFTRQVHTNAVSPDVDVDQFITVLEDNMEQMQKKVPELARCKKAFGKIKESIGLLKDRFNGYYRDFVETKDSTIMMQNFILDVSKESNSDPQTLQEFRKIIEYYRKMSQQNKSSKDPKMQALFSKLSDTFKEIERGTGNIGTSAPVDTSEPDSDPIAVTGMTADAVLDACAD